MNKDELQAIVNFLGPWHYCFQFPHGVVTGDSPPNLLPEKMEFMLARGLFMRPIYPMVLDLGSNAGYISMWFANKKQSVVHAYEAGPKYYPQLELAIDVLDYNGIIIPHNENIVTAKFDKNKYDLVLLLGVLHHIEEPERQQIINKARDALLPGGEIVVQTKTELPVYDMLVESKLTNLRIVGEMAGYNRTTWYAMKDPMKV